MFLKFLGVSNKKIIFGVLNGYVLKSHAFRVLWGCI